MIGVFEIGGECGEVRQGDYDPVSHASGPIGEIGSALQVQDSRNFANKAATSGEVTLNPFRWHIRLEAKPGNVK